MRSKGIILSLVCLGLAGAVCADDATPSFAKSEKDFGLRASIGNAPGIDTFNVDGAGDLGVDQGSGAQLQLLLQQRFWADDDSTVAGTLGGGIFFTGNNGEEDGGSDDAELSAFGLMGQGGLAVRLGEHVVLEAMPYAGIGAASVEITGFDDGSGSYIMYGVKGGAFINLGESVELGLELGYQGFRSDFEIEMGPADFDAYLSGDGLVGAAVLSIKM